MGVAIEPLIEATVARGGHVRVGLEDAPMGCDLGNLALAQQARQRIEGGGGQLAGTAVVRAALQAARVVAPGSGGAA